MSKVKGGVTSSHFQAGQGPGMPPRIWVQIRSSTPGRPRGGLSSARARQSLDQTGTPGVPADATPSVPAL